MYHMHPALHSQIQRNTHHTLHYYTPYKLHHNTCDQTIRMSQKYFTTEIVKSVCHNLVLLETSLNELPTLIIRFPLIIFPKISLHNLIDNCVNVLSVDVCFSVFVVHTDSFWGIHHHWQNHYEWICLGSSEMELLVNNLW